jgi:membrane protease subunit HflK
MEEIFINTRKIEAWIKKYLLRLLIGLLLLIGIATAVKTIEPEEEGVVLTLGKYSRTLEPGIEFIAPFGMRKDV